MDDGLSTAKGLSWREQIHVALALDHPGCRLGADKDPDLAAAFAYVTTTSLSEIDQHRELIFERWLGASERLDESRLQFWRREVPQHLQELYRNTHFPLISMITEEMKLTPFPWKDVALMVDWPQGFPMLDALPLCYEAAVEQVGAPCTEQADALYDNLSLIHI